MYELTLNPTPAEGAGLPRYEALFAKHWFLPRARRVIGWSAARARFFHAGHRALDLVEGMPGQVLGRPVHIARLRGLEPRSCDYSLADTLEHLTRFADVLALLLPALADGGVSPQSSIEDLKPRRRSAPAAVPNEFRAALVRVERALDALPTAPADGRTAEHPWFGPFDAHGWLVLAAVHQRLHLAQMERIAGALGLPQPRVAEELPVHWLAP